MKSVRNNLLKYDIFFNDNKKASWTYIEAFYASDKSKPLRLAPKLTNIIDYKNIKTWEQNTPENPPGTGMATPTQIRLIFVGSARGFVFICLSTVVRCISSNNVLGAQIFMNKNKLCGGLVVTS
jgi:hypothetical protein